MENENENAQEETVEQEEQVSEEVVEEQPVEKTQEEVQDDKIVLSKSDFNKLNRKAIAYETTKKNPINNTGNQLDSVDLIKLGKKLQDYSDEELDFVTEHAKSKKPEDILKALENPYIRAGIEAQREKVEKEKLTLKPSGTQPDYDAPKSLEERLESARTQKEKQEILEEYGLYQEPRRRPDSFNVRV